MQRTPVRHPAALAYPTASLARSAAVRVVVAGAVGVTLLVAPGCTPHNPHTGDSYRETGWELAGDIAETGYYDTLTIPLDGAHRVDWPNPAGWADYRLLVNLQGMPAGNALAEREAEVLALVDAVLLQHAPMELEDASAMVGIAREIEEALSGWAVENGFSANAYYAVEVLLEALTAEE